MSNKLVKATLMVEENKTLDPREWIAEHVGLYFKDPEKAHMWDSTPAGGPGILPTLLLTTIGRKSGEQRHSPLIYEKTNEGYIIVASKGGAPSQPAWYLNLMASPQCEIRVGTEKHRVIARIREGEERAELWNVMAKLYPPYNDYQAGTDRQIPIVVLEPAESN
jgi:deazaflavin-dependent oxidoreductase (nitroreductase family)